MAVKKVGTKLENDVIDTQEVVEVVEETPEVEIPEVEVTTSSEVEVDTDVAEVKVENKPNSVVKIRMRVDHNCCIAMERYCLKAGKTYNVPENVKRILNKAGLLAPL